MLEQHLVLVGDIHGAWATAVDALERLTAHYGPIDAALCVGDAEPIRSDADLAMVSGPERYRHLGTFHQILAGELELPCPWYFIGGNHEPWEALDDHGPGEIARNVHYLGRAGTHDIAGVRIAFLSGIFSPKRSVTKRLKGPSPRLRTYFDTTDLLAVRAVGHADILLTHDWPSGIQPEGGRDLDHEGSGLVRDVCELLRPQVHAVGHRHFAHRGRIGSTEVVALDRIREPLARSFVDLRIVDGVFAERPTHPVLD